jgi:hypothetical protein
VAIGSPRAPFSKWSVVEMNGIGAAVRLDGEFFRHG